MAYPALPNRRNWAFCPAWALAAALACGPGTIARLAAQQSASPEVSTRQIEPSFTLQSERNLVTVRVVVRNGKGEVVDSLQQDDFQLYDRGKKQTILQFSVEKPTPGTPEPTPKESAGRDSASRPAVGETAPPVSLPRRFVALYFDDVNTGFSGLARTRDAAARFLQKALRPGDRIGVFTASARNTLDFTDDLLKVREALGELRPAPRSSRDEFCGAITPYEAYLIVTTGQVGSGSGAATDVVKLVQLEKQNCDGTSDPPSPEEIRMEAMRVQAESTDQALASLRGIESLVRRMTTLPGQRSIVIVSDGFLSPTLGGAVSQISDRALHANIVINALDARALYVVSTTADASVAGRDLPPTSDLRDLKAQLAEAEARRASEAMGTLAQDTGGKLIENTNDLEAGFRRVAAVPDACYILAFSPENLKHDGAFRSLKVAVISPKGLTVQARKGYYAPKKAEDLAAQEKEDIQDAVFAQNEIQSLPIQVNTQYLTISNTEAEIDVVTHVDLQALRFRRQADRNVNNLTFVTVVFDRDGHYLSGQQKVLELRLRDVSLEQLLRTGVKVESDFNVKPGVYLIRTVVRDSENGEISALNRTVEIPE